MNDQLEHAQLGPFVLVDTLGVGSMGRVFKAHYPAQDTHVAVKLIRGDHSILQSRFDAFHLEVQAMAGLDHPGIAHIFDYGKVTDREAEQWPDLDVGVPWLAMELGVGHTLESGQPVADWRVLKRVLLEILDALAHAHARGIIHRDLKPANILIAPDFGGLKLLLADFGIVHVWNAMDNTDTTAVDFATAGTPHYMAPEQLHGTWRDTGPWTDLYAFGCMAYELICGVRPYDAPNVLGLAMAHLHSDIPRLKPRFEVPEGLDVWMYRLLAKEPFARMASAAQAAWMLNELEGTATWPPRLGHDCFDVTIGDDASAATGSQVVDPVGATLDLSATNVIPGAQLARIVREDRMDHGVTQAVRRAHVPLHEQVPFPIGWKPPHTNRATQLRGAGEALIGLREIPFVDRDESRDKIWGAIQKAHETRQPQIVLVESEAGLGKSRLIEWTTRRAHELGVGPTLRLSSSAVAGTDEPLVQVIEEMFRVQGMSREATCERLLEMMRRIESILPEGTPIPWDQDVHSIALTNLIHPVAAQEPGDPVPAFQFDRAAQKYDLVARFLMAFSYQRTAMVWCDDAHYCQSMLGLIAHVRSNWQTNFPVVFLASYRPKVLETRPIEASTIAQFKSREHVLVRLDRLSDEHQKELVRKSLTLATDLVESVATRTGGDPFFATQLLESWVEDGVLIPSADTTGYLVDDSAVFPSSVRELAAYRLRKFAAQFDDRRAAEVTLGIAAAVARPMNRALLESLAARVGVQIPSRFAERLLNSGIGRRVRRGWSIDEGIFRDAVERHARQHGYWKTVHLACADEAEFGADSSRERLGRHLLAAGELERALVPLGQALDQKVFESSYAEAITMAKQIEATCTKVESPESDRARTHAMIRRAEALRFSGDFDEANALTDRLISILDRLGPKLSGELWRVKAGLDLMMADLPASIAAYERAAECFTACGDDVGLSQVRHGEGLVLVTTGDLKAAAVHLGEALNAAQRAGSERDFGWAHHALSELHMRIDPLVGKQHAQVALEVFQRIGTMSGVALAHRTLADCARIAGLRKEASEHYEATIEISNQIRSIHRTYGHMGHALLALDVGNWEEATRRLEPARNQIDAIPRLFRPITYLALMLSYVGLNRNDGFDEIASLVEPLSHVGALAHPDLITLPERAGDLYRERNDRARSLRAYRIAAAFAQVIGGDVFDRISKKVELASQ